jgi:hypothetical protein
MRLVATGDRDAETVKMEFVSLEAAIQAYGVKHARDFTAMNDAGDLFIES